MTSDTILVWCKNHGGKEQKELQIRPVRGRGKNEKDCCGKAISWTLSSDIQKAAGPLQVSAGLKGGAEAAIHAMRDAANAFNRLNRKVALHNVQYLCPPFATVLINTYRIPSRLFIGSSGEIESQEGTTQGDTLAMSFYGICIKPIIDILRKKHPLVSQVWLADDATSAAKLKELKEWWIDVIKEGEKYGYYVKPSKAWLILKNKEMLEETKTLFHDSPIINEYHS